MVYVNGISLHFGERVLLQDVAFLLNERDRIGLVGRNGAGKSTLLKIVSGQLSPDSGNIQFPRNFTIGYLRQDLDFTDNLPVIDEVKTCFIELNALNKELDSLNLNLAGREDYESDAYHQIIERLTEVNDRIHLISPGNLDAEIEKVLKGLGFKLADFQKKMKEFSGGWQMRVELAKLLLTKPGLLMLDEPTNHLDIESIIWLENYLKSYPGIVLIISHDKRFLNNATNKTVELELGRATVYQGNYEFFLKEKAQNREIRLAAFANQQKSIAQKEKTIARFMAKATKTSMAQSMQKQLDKIDRIEIADEDNEVFNLQFPKAPHSGRIVLDVQGINKSFGQNEVLKNIHFILEKGQKLAFVGKNGMGKTTMSRIIVGQLSPTSGKLHHGANVQIAYYAQNQAELLESNKTILETMDDHAPAEQRKKIRSILGSFLFSGEDVDKKVSVLSGGERARLAMACLVMKPGNLLVMDEPTNHLDMLSKEILKEAVKNYDGSLILVSHDREFLEGTTDKVYEFHEDGITEYLGDINYFLEKKNFADVRQIDLADKSGTGGSQAGQKAIDQAEQKQIKRKIQYLERDIEKVEEEIAKLGELLADPGFYQTKEFVETSNKLKELQLKNEQYMAQWESLVSQLEG